MSPRRMDISSLLRDPSPPRNLNDNDQRPRSIDALIHHSPQPPLLNRPILGFDALVHVASEERRRINAASLHDAPAKHHSFPHRRHRSPSPDVRFPFPPAQPSSPTIRPHHSASPMNTYPTLRRQYLDPPRSAPVLLADDARLHHTPPYLPPLPSPQLPPHSSPRNVSPHRHSPQLLRSQHYSSPVSGSTEHGVLSPRYSHGPRMAGGIEVLSSDPKPDLSNYQSTGRDVFAEPFVSESRAEHAWQETSSSSPLSGKTFPPDENLHLKVSPPHGGQESVLPRERAWSRLPHLPLVDVTTMDDGKGMGNHPNLLSQPLYDHRPTRVWEGQPKPREIPRRVSPLHMPAIVSSPLEPHPWSQPSQCGRDERSAREDQAMRLSHVVQENVRTSLQPTCEEPPSPRATTLSDLPIPFQGSCKNSPFSPPLVQPQSSIQSESQTYVPQLTAHAPISPSPDVDLNSGSELHPQCFDSLVDPETTTPLTSSDPIITDSLSKTESMPEVLDVVDVRMVTPLARQLSLSLPQNMSAMDTGMCEMAAHSTRASSASRSLSQQPPILLPTKDEECTHPEVIPIPTPICSELPCPPLELEYNSKGQLPVSDQITMDVDEELLSLVEDRPPLPAVPAAVKMQIDPSSMGGQGTGVSTEERSNEAAAESLSSQPVVKGPLLITDEEKDRASMPPPAVRGKKGEKTTSAGGTVTGSKKKRDGTSKPAQKPKQPLKPRTKPVPKPKVKPTLVDTGLKGKKNSVTVNARSRSTSVIPGPVDDIVPEPEAEDGDKEDDKLYCVCETRYDEDRTMIACDRCDEWFHTQCVGIPELEIDLVDQFICPPCIQKHPRLRTTWKQRCLFGLQHENPSSPEACHKPSRGAFSKYCSDECGIKYMQIRVTRWETSGGARDLLWECVKNAAKREGVVVHAETNRASPRMMDIDGDILNPKPLDSAAKRREVIRLNARLDEVVKEREFMKRELDMVTWREKVVERASERAGKVDECGWDQRLCFGEEEWADFGSEVLESYEEERAKMDQEDSMPTDASSAVHGEWWCTGKKKCERHAGWQKLRTAEVSFDKETKEGILLKLTTREREIRKRIEDILFPQLTGTSQASSKRSRPEVQLNGSGKPIGHVSERGGKKI